MESAEHGTLYHIKDPAQMKKAFAERNIAKERAQWLFNYDPLKVPLQDEDLPL
jgi:salicylate hydroxylase